MRRAVVVISLLCFAVLGTSQTPKDKRIPKQNGTLDSSPASETKDNKQDATTPPNQTIAIYNQPRTKEHDSDNKQSQDAIGVERKLTKFTGYLVIVGFLQVLALIAQAILFFQQRNIMEQHRGSLEQLATAASSNAIAAKASADTLVNSERSWVIPELGFLSDKGVVGYTGSKSLVDINVVCTNLGNTLAWITEINVHMEIGQNLRIDPNFTPEGQEISLLYAPVMPDGDPFELPLRQVAAEGDIEGKTIAFASPALIPS